MIYKIFSVYDVKTGFYDRPFCSSTRGEALRAFGDIAKDKAHPIGAHPEDYSLFDLGHFDNLTGTFRCEVANEKIACALDFVVERPVGNMDLFNDSVGLVKGNGNA